MGCNPILEWLLSVSIDFKESYVSNIIVALMFGVNGKRALMCN